MARSIVGRRIKEALSYTPIDDAARLSELAVRLMWTAERAAEWNDRARRSEPRGGVMDGISEDTTTVIVANVPVRLVEAMRRISDAHDRSMSTEYRWAIRQHVMEHDRMLVEEAGLPPLVKDG